MNNTPKSTQQVKIALIGPVQPYRGGIAQYTTELHRVLRREVDGPTISFKRQYPSFLYPGDTDLLGENMPFDETGVDYRLDIYNPLSWRKAADQVIASDSQLVLLNWWTLIWQPATAYMARRMRRSSHQARPLVSAT